MDALRDPLTMLGVVLLSGALLGFAARRARLPAVTGQILAGFLLGPSVLDAFGAGATGSLTPLTRFALGLMALTVGSHLDVRRLRNAGRRLFYLLLGEAVFTPLIVFGALFYSGHADWSTSLLIATVAVSTAPATVVAVVAECRAKGVFVKTLIAAVALNNIACVVLFELARAVTRGQLVPDADDSLWAIASEPLRQLALSALIGGLAGIGIVWFTRRTVRLGRQTTAAIVTILVVVGVSRLTDVSPLLTCLFLGVAQANLTPNKDEFVESFFENLRPAILAVFFTLAGLHLHLEHAAEVGLLVGIVVVGRMLGKLLAAQLAMTIAGAPARVRNLLGLALTPQAGLAVGLVVVIQDDPAFAPLHDTFVATVLGCVTANEVIGPLLTRWALRRSGEAGRDRARILDFLQEENIVTGLQADRMEHAIEKLTDLLIDSHRLEGVDRAQLLRSILDREAQVSTCIGQGLAIPHGELTAGDEMRGVMAISREGLPFPTPDGKPVHCLVLVATPSGARDRHLEVLAAIARTFGVDDNVRQALFAASSPAHAYEILHGEETEGFNRYLDDDTSSTR